MEDLIWFGECTCSKGSIFWGKVGVGVEMVPRPSSVGMASEVRLSSVTVCLSSMAECFSSGWMGVRMPLPVRT